MAFFKFRKGGDASPSAPAQTESVDVLRRRARHRLIGAAVLVLLGVVGFPLLFDTQPRPISVDIPIEIPDRTKARPLPAPPAPKTQGKVAEPAASAAPAAAASVAAVAKPQPAPAPAPEPVAAAKPEVPARPEPAKPAAEPARVAAVPEVRPAQAAAVEGRYVVQVGAFADVGKARETRLKVEKAGLKTYTHVAETKEGKRIRVRVGPFQTRAEADKAASRIKDLDLPAAVLTL